WRVVFWVKLIEAICQLRPKSLFRLLAHPDPLLRAGMRWYSNIGRRVWVHEVWQWLFFDRRTRHGPMLVEFLKGGWHRDWNSQQSGSVAGTEPVPIRPKSPLSETPQPWPVASASLSSLAVNHSNVSPLTPGVEAAWS